MELLQLFDEECEADQAQRVRIRRHINLARGEDAALRRAQNVRRTVEEDEVLVRLNLGELLVKHEVGRPLRFAIILVLEVDEVEGGRDEIEAGQELLARLALDDILDDQVLHLTRARLEDRVDRTGLGGVDLVPALKLQEPDAPIRLRVEIEEQDPIFPILASAAAVLTMSEVLPTPPL